MARVDPGKALPLADTDVSSINIGCRCRLLPSASYAVCVGAALRPARDAEGEPRNPELDSPESSAGCARWRAGGPPLHLDPSVISTCNIPCGASSKSH